MVMESRCFVFKLDSVIVLIIVIGTCYGCGDGYRLMLDMDGMGLIYRYSVVNDMYGAYDKHG